MATATQREVRLEERVRELESELDQQRTSRRRRAYRDFEARREDFADLGERKVDEISRLFTGAVRASLEGLRVAAESTTYFAGDVLERNVPDRDETSFDVARRLPLDLSSGIIRS